MVENFNKKIKNKILKKYFFDDIFALNEKLIEFVKDKSTRKLCLLETLIVVVSKSESEVGFR